MKIPTLRAACGSLLCASLLALSCAATAATAPDITSFEAATVDQLAPGTELRFRVTGTPGARATVRVPGLQQPIRLSETRPGVYEGYYTLRRADKITPQGPVRAVLRNENVSTTSTLATPLVAGYAPAGGIQRFTMEPATTEPGTELTFRLHGTPGGTAVVDLGNGSGRSVALTEVQSGVYEGNYTVRRQDRFSASTVTARLQAGNRTLRAGLADAPSAGAAGAAAALTTIEIISPADQSAVGSATVEVRGRSAPNTVLNVHVNAKGAYLGFMGYSNLVLAREVMTDSRGNFAFTFEPKDQAPGTRYEVLVNGTVAGQPQQKVLNLLVQR